MKHQILKSDNGNIHSVSVPGHRDEQSSYRGELGGILAGLDYATKTLRLHDVTSGTCTFSCDNKGALDASFGWKTPNPNWKCYDLVSAIRHRLRNSPIKWIKKHVKGHQDSGTEYHELSNEAQANVIADKYAKTELNKGITIVEGTPNKGDIWKLYCCGHDIRGYTEKRLRLIMQETKAREWWEEKLRCPDEHTIESHGEFTKDTEKIHLTG